MKKCPNSNCGVLNGDDAKYCRACGNPLKRGIAHFKIIMYIFNAFFILALIYCFLASFSYTCSDSYYDSDYYGREYDVKIVAKVDPLDISNSTGFFYSSETHNNRELAYNKTLKIYYAKVLFGSIVIAILTFISFFITKKI